MREAPVTMTLPQNKPTPKSAPDTTFDSLDSIVAELDRIKIQYDELLDHRNVEMRRLHQEEGIPVSELRSRTGLSKSMVRLISTPQRWAN